MFRSLLTSFALLALIAPTPGNAIEPEYNLQVCALNADGSALIQLERQSIHYATKIKAFGYGGAQSSMSFRDARSPIRFKRDEKVEFVVRFDMPGQDPSAWIELQPLKVSKNTREIVVAKVGALGMGVKTTEGDAKLSIDIEQYGDHSVKFSAAQPLPPGEYAVTTKGGMDAFLFGID